MEWIGDVMVVKRPSIASKQRESTNSLLSLAQMKFSEQIRTSAPSILFSIAVDAFFYSRFPGNFFFNSWTPLNFFLSLLSTSIMSGKFQNTLPLQYFTKFSLHRVYIVSDADITGFHYLNMLGPVVL